MTNAFSSYVNTVKSLLKNWTVPRKIQMRGGQKHGISRDIEKQNVKIPGLKK